MEKEETKEQLTELEEIRCQFCGHSVYVCELHQMSGFENYPECNVCDVKCSGCGVWITGRNLVRGLCGFYGMKQTK